MSSGKRGLAVLRVELVAYREMNATGPKARSRLVQRAKSDGQEPMREAMSTACERSG